MRTKREKIRGARAACAVATVLVAGGPAQAFYWYDWPGSGLLVQKTLVSAPAQGAPTGGPVLVGTPPPDGNNPPGTGPSPPVSPPVPVNGTPEPATGLLGLMGLGTLAAVRKLRKK